MKKLFLCLGILLCKNLTVWSQQKNDTDTTSKQLKAVIIFSSPYEARKQMPLSYSFIDSAVIRKIDYGAEPSFILQRFPGITFTTDNGTNFGYSYFRLRGLDQSRINITINGLPLNEPEDAGTYFSNFASLISYSSSVQMQRGLGLSKNGAPAFGGSLDFETKRSASSKGGALEAGLEAGSFSSARLYSERQDSNKNNLFYYKLNVLRSDGYKYHSENRSESGLFQWQRKAKNWQLQYLLLAGKNVNGLGWLGVNDSVAKADFKNNGNTEREKGNFFQLLQQLHISAKLKKNQTFHAGVFYNYTKGNYGFDLYNFLGIPSQGPLIDYRTHSSYSGILLDYQSNGKNYSFTAGIYSSLYRKYHDAVQDPNNILLYHNYGDKNEFSPFAKFIFRKDRFYFFTDLQYRHATFSYHGDAALKDFKWNFFNPLVGFGYRLSENVYLYASGGNIQREPGRNDIFLGNDNLGKDSSGQAIFADLVAENNFSLEAGIRYEKKNFQGSLNFYRMKILHAIDLNGQIGPTGLPLHSNVAKAIRKGIEAELNYRFSENWSFLQTIAWAPHHIIEEEKTSTPVLTPELISFSEIKFMQDKWMFALQGRFQSKSYVDFANHYQLSSSTIFNFISRYNLKKIFFSLRLFNVTDQKIYSSGQLNIYGQPIYLVQAPFNFNAGIGVHL